MAIKVTTWSPDTCSCIFEYEWDTDDSESTRANTLKRLVQACAAHSAGTDAQKYTSVVTENQAKNLGVAAVVSRLGRGMTAEDVAWSIDEARDITLRAAASAPEETAVRTDLGAISAKLKFQRR